MNTFGGRIHVEWSPQAAVTLLGQLPFFIEFLKTAELFEPWILDLDTTVKPLCGHRERAAKGFNPQKPGRPSHTYHTYFLANPRLVLDVEVRPGNHAAAKYTSPSFFAFVETLERVGNEDVMCECEKRSLSYLFKLRQTAKAKRLIERLFSRADWTDAGQGWQGVESSLRLGEWGISSPLRRNGSFGFSCPTSLADALFFAST